MDLEKIEKALNELMVLNIRTVVGEFAQDAEGKLQYQADKAHVILTQINLLQGDITTALGEEFLRPPLEDVRDFHASRERQARDIVRSNFQTLVEIANAVADMARRDAGRVVNPSVPEQPSLGNLSNS